MRVLRTPLSWLPLLMLVVLFTACTGGGANPTVKDYSVSGAVKDQTGTGISEVSIIYEGSVSGTTSTKSDGKYEVDVFACEGCGVCEAICPVGAVVLQPDVAGELRVYKDKDIFSTARLKMGSGTSGKLVTEVKKQLKDETENLDIDLSVIDGSPGIGCPVIASLSGVDMVLIVAEPSLSGISDMERIIKLAQGFSLKLAVCVNKYDTNPDLTHKIEAFCREHGLPFAGKIPFDAKALKATNQGQSIIEVDCSAGRAVTEVYSNTMNVLNKE